MDAWELDFEWLQVRHKIKDLFNKDALPDLNAILFVIGIQEYGHLKDTYTKEEKQDLMHIAICRLLSEDGYYSFEGIDARRLATLETGKESSRTRPEKNKKNY
ncbi:MAG: hypothetical protein R2769_06670 [Saprospiraceae bacterium]